MYTRRQWGKLALVAMPLSGIAATNGVEIGIATFSYNPLPLAGQLDVIIGSMRDCGVKSCLLNPPSTDEFDGVPAASCGVADIDAPKPE
jgi:hypothetical protein